MSDLILLKIGGSIITEKDVSEPKINAENLERICGEIAEAYKTNGFKLVIIHGAGSFGHPIVKRTGIHEGITRPDQVLSFATTQVLQNILNSEVCQTLQKFDLPAIPVQPSASAIMDKKRLISLNHELIKALLELSLIPVLFGVPAFDKSQKCSILSGDQIIVYLAKKLQPQKLVFITNVDGILDKNGGLIEKITRENFESVKNSFYEASYDDVTGSMAGKISELQNISGVTSYIVNGNKSGLINSILKGNKVRGTKIEF
ncbi:MAG: isopentenyl phosphate kinase family protein [Candidatus Helarchaeota archaeon]|nr:isopentenyl phosphate kinase family protein [Candidatus Helarchaeota archaeon]